MKNIRNALIVVAIIGSVALSSTASYAQVRVGTGSAEGTYSTMFKQLQAACGATVAMTETNTSGSNDNLDQIMANQLNAAWVQTDVLFFRARTEEMGNIKTLLAMHPEEVHFLAPAVAKNKEGGTLGIGAKVPVFTSVENLVGRTVGAVGGSFTTAQVIRLQSEINFSVQQFTDAKALMVALDAGTIEAAVFVGGAPMPALAALGPNYKLLSFSEATQNKLKNVYRPARVSYNKMNANGLATVATDALFVTREYKTPRMVEQLAKFRACATAAAPELSETIGTHPKWKAVDPSNKGKWAYYDLPAATGDTSPKAVAAQPAKTSAQPAKK